MAVIDKLEVQVVINDTPVHEYQSLDASDEIPAQCTRYIEAENDVQFGIRIAILETMSTKSTSLSFWIFLDGTLVSRNLVEERRGIIRPQMDTIRGVDVGDAAGWQLRRFVFKDINFIDEPSHPGLSQQDIESLGKIEVRVFHVERLGPKTKERLSDLAKSFDTRTIPEAKVKAMNLSHSVSLTEPIKKSTAPEVFSARYIDGKDAPFATFVFKYCSKKTLQILGHIARTPSPSPVAKRPVEEWTMDELRDFVRRSKAGIKFEWSGEEKVSQRFDRRVDPEYQDILASAKARRVRRTAPASEEEIVVLSDS